MEKYSILVYNVVIYYCRYAIFSSIEIFRKVINMAKEKLPPNITRRKDMRLYGRFKYCGKTYELYRDKDYNPKKLKKELDDLRYEVEHGIRGKQSDLTLNELFEIWINEYKINNKQGCIQTYVQVYENMIKARIGNKKIKDIKHNHVQSFINGLKKDYSLSRIKLAHVVLFSMLEVAIINDWIIKNPAKRIQFPKDTKKERRVMTGDEQHIFLRFARSSQYYDLYVVSLYTGMRIGEVLGLRWDDINFDKNNIHVSGTLTYIRGKGRIRDLPKSESGDRIIPMVSLVTDALRARRKRQLNMKLLLGGLYKEQGYVFTCESGEPYWDTSIRVDIKRIIDDINDSDIEFLPITPHTFRHTFATRCLEQGIKPKVLQEIMGHSQFSITMDLYGHVLEDEKEQEIQKLESII